MSGPERKAAAWRPGLAVDRALRPEPESAAGAKASDPSGMTHRFATGSPERERNATQIG
jgi:hypothetical protein